MNDCLFLVVGESGSGKTTIVENICAKHGCTAIQSYTTRAKRTPHERGHRFVSVDEMPPQDEMVAYTHYNGHHYWATQKDADENDFYIIDPQGLDFFFDHYRGNKTVYVVYLTATEPNRFLRMRARGDDIQKALDRIFLDRKEFFVFPYDIKFVNDDLTECEDSVFRYVQWAKGG